MFSVLIQALKQPLVAWVAGVLMGTVGTVSVVQAPEDLSSAPFASVRLADESFHPPSTGSYTPPPPSTQPAPTPPPPSTPPPPAPTPAPTYTPPPTGVPSGSQQPYPSSQPYQPYPNPTSGDHPYQPSQPCPPNQPCPSNQPYPSNQQPGAQPGQPSQPNQQQNTQPTAPTTNSDPNCAQNCKENRNRCDSKATDEVSVTRCEDAYKACASTCSGSSSGSQPGRGGQNTGYPQQGGQPGGQQGGQFGPPGGGQFGPPGGGGFPGGGHPGGEGEFDQEKFEKERQAQEAQQLEQAKRGFKQFVRQISQIKQRVKRLAAKKVQIPEDVNAAMLVLESAKERVDAITSFEDLQEIANDLQDAVETINERVGDLERLAEYGKVRRQAQAQATRLASQFKGLARRAAVAKVNVDELLAETNQLIEEVKGALITADAAASAGDADAAFEALEQGVFERMDEVQERFQAFEMVVRAPRELARVGRDIKQMEQLVRRLERQKKNVTALREVFSQIQIKFVEAKTIVARKPLSVPELVDVVESYEDLRDQFQDEANSLQGIREDLVKTGPEIELPSGFPERTPREPLPAEGNAVGL